MSPAMDLNDLGRPISPLHHQHARIVYTFNPAQNSHSLTICIFVLLLSIYEHSAPPIMQASLEHAHCQSALSSIRSVGYIPAPSPPSSRCWVRRMGQVPLNYLWAVHVHKYIDSVLLPYVETLSSDELQMSLREVIDFTWSVLLP